MSASLAGLTTLASEINAEIAAAERDARSAVEHARRAGELLAAAKAEVAHGEWLPWLRVHCRVSERTAQAYMRLARRLAELPGEEAQRVADLPLRGALAFVAESTRSRPRDAYPEFRLRLREALDELEEFDREQEDRGRDRLQYRAAVDEAARRLAALRAAVLERVRRDGASDSLPEEREEFRQVGLIWDREILPTIRRWGEDPDFASLYAEKFSPNTLEDFKSWAATISPAEPEAAA